MCFPRNRLEYRDRQAEYYKNTNINGRRKKERELRTERSRMYGVKTG
jgi:hypothetical protein